MLGLSPHKKDRSSVSLLAIVAGLCACLLWAYWPTLTALEQRWASDPQSSHGFIVPLYAGIVLWSRRASFPASAWAINPWGLALLAVAAVLRLAGAYVNLDWFDGFSLLLSVAGVTVLAGGWTLLRWAWPGVVLLFFLLPLPYMFEIALAGPLQRVATVAATYALQTIGYPAVAEGNIILIDHQRIGVVEACNGLGMLSAFFALSTAVVFLIQRPWYEKLIVFLSAIPIGLLVNLIRITATGWAHMTCDPRFADVLFHDYAGWLMMPLALFALWLELLVLKHLLVEGKAAAPVPVAVPRLAPAQPERTAVRT